MRKCNKKVDNTVISTIENTVGTKGLYCNKAPLLTADDAIIITTGFTEL